MNPTRIGKIARLPSRLREQLNRRLHEGELGIHLVAWLNQLPEVRQVLDTHFGGRPINPQNLSDWRYGGYRDWCAGQEARQLAGDLASQSPSPSPVSAAAIQPATDHASLPSIDHLASMLLARYSTVLYNLGLAPRSRLRPRKHYRSLHYLCEDVIRLRASLCDAERLNLKRRAVALQQERVELQQRTLDLDRQRTEQERIEEFCQWVQQPEIREILRRRFAAEALPAAATAYGLTQTSPQALPPDSSIATGPSQSTTSDTPKTHFPIAGGETAEPAAATSVNEGEITQVPVSNLALLQNPLEPNTLNDQPTAKTNPIDR